MIVKEFILYFRYYMEPNEAYYFLACNFRRIRKTDFQHQKIPLQHQNNYSPHQIYYYSIFQMVTSENATLTSKKLPTASD